MYKIYFKHLKLSFPFKHKHKQCFIRNYSSNCRNNNKNVPHQVKLNPSLPGKDSPAQASQKIYLDADTQKVSIVTENRNLCGVYKWTNKLSGKVYIGSSANLSKRLSNYYSYSLISRFQHSMLIYKALLKHGYSNFSLEILEYCNPSNVIEREQYYIDLFNPEYNLLPTAGSPLGYKHTEETLLKFKARKMTASHLAKLTDHLRKLGDSDEHKDRSRLRMLEINKKKSYLIEVIDTETDKTLSFDSIRQAATALGCTHSSILYHIKRVKETGDNKHRLLGKYLVKIKNDEEMSESKQHYTKVQGQSGVSIEVLDIETEKTVNYASINEAAKAIGYSPSTIRAVIKLFREKGIKRPIKKRYIISTK